MQNRGMTLSLFLLFLKPMKVKPNLVPRAFATRPCPSVPLDKGNEVSGHEIVESSLQRNSLQACAVRKED